VSDTLRLEPQNTSLSAPAKIGWAILICLTLGVCYFSHLGAIGFVGPDEPRYAWIARAMAETGDWVTPRLYGQPWFEKPPLFYWGAALSFKLFGVSEAAARLPSAISALLATLAMGWLAWRMYGGETARWLLILLPTTVGMIGFSHAAATDMPFSAMLTIAMVCAAVVLRLVPSPGTTSAASPRKTNRGERGEDARSHEAEAVSTTTPSQKTPWLALLLFGFFLGLAALAKGPAAIVLCGGAVFFWALFTKRWRDALRLLHPAAIAVFCVTALPWYILCARRNADFLRIFIIEHNFKRYLTPEFQHIQPFWFYVPVLLIALVPWTLLFVWKVAGFLPRSSGLQQLDAPIWFVVCWSGFTLLFFSISRSKLPGYILPAIPPIAFLVGCEIKRRTERPETGRFVFVALGSSLILLGGLVTVLGTSIPFVTDAWPPNGVSTFQIVAVLAGLLGVVLALTRKPRFAGLVMVLSVLAFMTLDTGQLWMLDEGVSARPAAALALDHMTSEQASAAKVFKLRRAYKYQVDFYLHREMQEWSPSTTEHSIVFTDYKNSAEFIRLGGWCPPYIAFPAVWVCEDSKDNQILMRRSAGGR
jgi:4-amino-4-deoxy-L-arabinose transferase-like glycosyltransferase